MKPWKRSKQAEFDRTGHSGVLFYEISRKRLYPEVPSPCRGTPVFLDEEASSVQVNRNDETANPDNGFTESRRKTYYRAEDTEYIGALKKALEKCESTGRWSVTRNDLSLYDARKLLEKRSGDPGPYWQILWDHEADNPVYILLSV